MLAPQAMVLALAVSAPEASGATSKGTYKGCEAWVGGIKKGRSIDVNISQYAPPQLMEATRTGEHLLQVRGRFKRTRMDVPVSADCGALDCRDVTLVGPGGEEYSPLHTNAPSNSCRPAVVLLDNEKLGSVQFDNKQVDGFPTFFFAIPEKADPKTMHLRLGNERLLLKK